MKGGLGYCSKLVFESTHKGENVKNIMVWDAGELQKQLNDHKLDMDASSLVDSVINIDSVVFEEDQHFFKVIMEDVKNKDLLDRRNIEEYLSMVAPVPFSSHFIFKNLIKEEISKESLSIDEYRIFINTDQLYKGYTTSLYDGLPPNNKKYDEIFDIDTIKIQNAEKEIIAWGWYGISKFEKQIPTTANIARGIRLRKGNIQIGSENALVKLHKEQRGNFYFIGEIHAFHPDLIPNSRRDYFNENKISKFLDQKLKEIFHNKLHRLYHDANKLKNAVKRIDRYKEISEEYREKIETGSFSSKQQENDLIENMEQAKKEAKNKHKELLRFKKKAEDNETLNKLYNKVVSSNIDENFRDDLQTADTDTNLNKAKYRTQKLTKLSRREERVIRKVFEIIDLMLPDLKERGEELKKKIEEEFK